MGGTPPLQHRPSLTHGGCLSDLARPPDASPVPDS
jgi:hypothetical protein